MHFTRLGAYGSLHEVPVMVRGEGAYVWDQHGKRYLDGLSGLFTSQIGHGRTELAERVAGLAPGDLTRVFFTTGGSEAVESGLMCRTDDRGDPVVQLSPPLICGQTEIDLMARVLRDVLTEVWRRI
jgi:adenosylmethionine-8-amino-7-oxononanoate aminotransferase